jgi:hypothetical protein
MMELIKTGGTKRTKCVDEKFIKTIDSSIWYDCDICYDNSNNLKSKEYVSSNYDGTSSVYRKIYGTVDDTIFCYWNPVENNYEESSEYLSTIFKDEPKTLWIANMVTYYRHTLKSWNNTWNRGGYGWNKISTEVYEQEKIKVNERQKRKIVKNHSKLLIENNIELSDFLKLQNTDEKTIEYINKNLK